VISGVGIYDGFNGTETLRSQRDWHNNPVVLTGGIGGAALFDNIARNHPR